MLLAAALGHERLGAAKVAGVLLTIVGVALALGEKALTRSEQSLGWSGEAAVFGAAVSGAVCSVLYRPYVRTYPTVPVSAFAMLASVGFLAVLAGGEGFFAGWRASPAAAGPPSCFIGLSSGVGYFLWLWALGNAPATEVTVFLALSPFHGRPRSARCSSPSGSACPPAPGWCASASACGSRIGGTQD